jgi:hypothetical protein
MLGAWRRFWFAPASLVDLGAARVVLALILLLLVGRTRYDALLHAPAELYAPVGVLRWLDVGPPAAATVVGLARIVPALIVAVALGIGTRAALLALLGAFTILESWLNAYGKISHGTVPLFFAILAIALAPSDRTFTLGRAWRRLHGDVAAPAPSTYARWPLEFVYVELAAFYATAGIAKLRSAGPAWADGYTLQYHLLAKQQPAGLWLAEHVELCALLSTLVLTFELTFPLSVVLRRLRPAFLAGGVLFHLGTTAFMGVTFWPVVALYALFLPWEATTRWLREQRGATIRPSSTSAEEPRSGEVPLTRGMNWGSR